MTPALVRPSSAARLVQCAMSLTAELRFPEGETEAAREGTAAHWVLQEMIGGTNPTVGALAPNGHAITEEMIEGAEMALEQIEGDLAPFAMSLGDVAVEVPLDIPRVHAECRGTPDLRAWVPASRHPQGVTTLYLWDYKFGHRPVEAFENYQCIAYVVGAADQAGIGEAGQAVIGIIQPRAYHRDGPCRFWKTRLDNLRQYINVYSSQAHAALAASPAASTGPECQDCSARHACDAYQRATYVGIDLSTRAQPLEMDPAALGLEARLIDDALDRLKGRQSGLYAQIESLIRGGKSVPGWSLARGPGRLGWIRPVNEVLAAAAMMGVNVAKPVALITPSQARFLGLAEPLVAAFSARQSGDAKVTRDSGTEARKVFGNY